MSPSDIFKIFGPLSVLVTGMAIILTINRWQSDRSKSISQNVAAHRSSYLIMLVVQSITLPMLYLFWTQWLVVELRLPSLFTVFASVTSLGLLLAAWIPDTKGIYSNLHKVLAYAAGMPVIPMLVMLFQSPNISPAVKYVIIAVLIYDIAAIAVVTTRESIRRIQLYLEFAYIFLFASTTVAAAYL